MVKDATAFYPTFDPVPSDFQAPQISSHAGLAFQVVGRIEDLEYDAGYVVPAYEILLEDGCTVTAWTEEISPEVTVSNDFRGQPWQHRDTNRAAL